MADLKTTVGIHPSPIPAVELTRKEQVNVMVDTLRLITEQVSNVAREVGTEGLLGGQAKVPNVEGVRPCADDVGTSLMATPGLGGSDQQRELWALPLPDPSP